MQNSGGIRTREEMLKRTTQSSETTNLKQKRTRSHPVANQEWVSEIPVRNLPIQNHSASREGGGKSPKHRHSRNRDGVAKKLGSPHQRFDPTSTRRKSEPDNSSVHTLKVFYDAASSSSSLLDQPDQATEENPHSELCACSDDGTGKLQCDHGATPSPAVPDDPPTLLPELIDDIIGRIESMQEVMRLRSALGKAFKDAIHRPAFRRNRPRVEGEFSPSFFTTDAKGDLHWVGLDTKLRKWTWLPSLNFAKTILPSPDQDLFKDYLIAGDGGLLCINVGKAPDRERLVICNPLTQQVKELPPLKYARHPVLMLLKVDHDSGHYKVIVAGSAAIGTDALSLKTEEYDSRTGQWDCPDGSDLPCPAFGLNEYQNGAYFRDAERELLMCIAIVDTRGRGVLVYDVRKKKWAQEMPLHIPLVSSVSHLATTQIVECGGSVFVFSEQECGRDVYFMVHKLVPEASGDGFTWGLVLKRKRTGGRGLLVYPEFTCVPVSEHELCIFNTVEHTTETIICVAELGIVNNPVEHSTISETIDLSNDTDVTPLQAAPVHQGNRFHSLNPIGFVFQPSFRTVVCPRGRNPDFRCVKGRQHCSECIQRRDLESDNVVPKSTNAESQGGPNPAEEKDHTPTGRASPEKRHVRCGSLADDRNLGDKFQNLVLSK